MKVYVYLKNECIELNDSDTIDDKSVEEFFDIANMNDIPIKFVKLIHDNQIYAISSSAFLIEREY